MSGLRRFERGSRRLERGFQRLERGSRRFERGPRRFLGEQCLRFQTFNSVLRDSSQLRRQDPSKLQESPLVAQETPTQRYSATFHYTLILLLNTNPINNASNQSPVCHAQDVNV